MIKSIVTHVYVVDTLTSCTKAFHYIRGSDSDPLVTDPLVIYQDWNVPPVAHLRKLLNTRVCHFPLKHVSLELELIQVAEFQSPSEEWWINAWFAEVTPRRSHPSTSLFAFHQKSTLPHSNTPCEHHLLFRALLSSIQCGSLRSGHFHKSAKDRSEYAVETRILKWIYNKIKKK